MRQRRSWRFGPFEVDAWRRELYREGALVRLRPKPLALLLHLVRRAGQTVPRRELIEAVWPGVSVSEAAYLSVVRDLRRALGDKASTPSYIATVRGEGLRLLPPVEVREHEAAESVPSGVADGAEGGTPDAAWREAARHLERALGALDLVQRSRGQAARRDHAELGASRERGEILVLLAQARWAVGSTGEARSAFRDAAETARRLGDAEILARAALGFAGRTDVTPGVNHEAVALLEEALGRLGEKRPALRAEVLARLGTELYHDPDMGRADRLTREAVVEAEGAGDPAVLAYALTALHFVLERPDEDLAERLRLADRAIALVGEGDPSDVLAIALQERLLDLLEQGDGPGFEATLERYALAVRDLGQPFFTWLLAVFRCSRALLAGELGEAELAMEEARRIGEQIATPNALSVFAGQLFVLRDQQGRLGELRDLLAGLVGGQQALPIFRAAVASVVATGEDADAARRSLRDVFSRGLDDFPRDQSWLGVLGLLAPAVARHAEVSAARRLIALFEPYAGRIIVVGYGAALLGSVSHHLGLLHACLGDRRAALRHLEVAQREHRRLGSRFWVERSRRAFDDAASA